MSQDQQANDYYAEIADYEREIYDKALRLLYDPTFCLDDETEDDREEIQGRATDLLLAIGSNLRSCAEEGCCQD